MTNYDTRRIQRESFKMEVTEAIRAHGSNVLDIAERKYKSAAEQAIKDKNGEFYDVLTFLATQADGSRQRTLEASIKMAVQLGYTPALEEIVPLIEDPGVKNALEECVSAAKVGRKADTKSYKKGLESTTSGRYRLP